jgi:AraC-like DNA-binding protein
MTLILKSNPITSPYIERVWHAQCDGDDSSFISSASTHWEMVVTRYEGKTALVVRGPETKASSAPFPNDFEAFGITFKLGTFMPHLSLKTIMDRSDLNIPLATSQSIWLNGAAWEIPTFENADVFVDRLVRQNMLAHEPVVEAMMRGESPDFSIRALQYRFLRATGLTHNTYRQIERSRHAVTLLEQGVSILDTTFEAGYFDQAHLTRSLKRFMGQTPAQLLRESQPTSFAFLYNTYPSGVAIL